MFKLVEDRKGRENKQDSKHLDYAQRVFPSGK